MTPLKRLLIIDPDCISQSPAMKGVMRSLPELRKGGFTIEVWCWEIDTNVEVDAVTVLPTFGARWLLHFQAMAFSMLVTLLFIWRFQVRGLARPDCVYSVLPYLPQADVAHAHFSPWDWECRMRDMGCHSIREWLERAVNFIMLAWHRLFLSMTQARLIVVPSEAVAADFRSASPHMAVTVMPNSYDPARFHQGVREQWRQATRHNLGFEERDVVFIFVSTGHYRRKGFFIAVAALEELRQRHRHVKFLVVGGRERALIGLRNRLDHQHSGWNDWLHFTGTTTQPEQFFAAADAFLYPSWSEAFALVEIEAAACGLPLFLTPHHGSEMVLEDGVNGRLIPFDSSGVAAVLEEFVSGIWRPTATTLKHALDRETYAQSLSAILCQA
ncbi:MAG: glycosyltransferase family 4 protein [Prosthecobacter sp.]